MITKTRKNFLRKILMCTLVVSLVLGTAFSAAPLATSVFAQPQTAAELPADIAGTTHENAIAALVRAGVITGDIDGLFHPFNNLTRAEACTIIVRAIAPPSADIIGTPTQRVPASGFPDMAGAGWAENYVSFAVRHGIVFGYPDGTFKPGNNVTSNEMLTMMLRAIGLTNEEIGSNWPYDFIARARQEGILQGLPENLPALATKEMAARMAYNKLQDLRAAGAITEDETELGEIENGQTTPWGTGNLNFRIGRINDNMTTFAGIPISRNVEVFTYGLRSRFSRNMELPENMGAYFRDTIHKFKNTNTSAFYIMTGDEITLMILPRDVGFSGRIYAVINSVSSTINAREEAVQNIHTLAAGRQVAWLTRDNAVTVPTTDFFDGQIFELTAVNGAIRQIAVPGDPNSHANFSELTAGNPWQEVSEHSRGIITLANGQMFAIADNAVVYVLNVAGDAYRVGSIWDITQGSEIRAFMIDNEHGEQASHVTVNSRR